MIQGRTASQGSVLGWGDELLGGVQSPFSLSLSLSLSLILYALILDSLILLPSLFFLSFSLILPAPLVLWVAGPIYRGPGPLPKYRAGREPTMAG